MTSRRDAERRELLLGKHEGVGGQCLRRQSGHSLAIRSIQFMDGGLDRPNGFAATEGISPSL